MPHTNHVELLPNRGWDDRILVCANPLLVNVFLVITHHHVVVVDTLINPATARRLMNIAAPYLAARRQLLVINTHADYDHAWGNQLFASEHARHLAPILAHRSCAQRLASPEEQALLQNMQRAEPDIFGPVRLTAPALLFDATMTILGGDLTLHLLHTPGHTPDHVAVHIPEIDTLLAGDAAEWPFPFADRPADLPTLRASLARLAGLHPRRALYCHAPTDAGPRLLQINLAYFAAVEAACRAALLAGIDTRRLDDDALGEAVGCRVTDALPIPDGWPAPDATELTAGHARQLRMMLDWLQQEGS